VASARIFAPDGTRLDVSEELAGPEVGYVLERKIFDRDLAKRAARAGADVVVRTRATGVITENGFIRGIEARHLGESLEIRASVVIAADGIESQVGRWPALTLLFDPKTSKAAPSTLWPTSICWRTAAIFYLGSAAPGGYAWAFPKGSHAANIGLGVLANKLDASIQSTI